jgi:hypothetical protein
LDPITTPGSLERDQEEYEQRRIAATNLNLKTQWPRFRRFLLLYGDYHFQEDGVKGEPRLRNMLVQPDHFADSANSADFDYRFWDVPRWDGKSLEIELLDGIPLGRQLDSVVRDWNQEQTKVEDLKSQLGSAIDRLEKLHRVRDARSDEEVAAGEPPHPPYARIFQTEQEIVRLRQEYAFEARMLAGLQHDVDRYRSDYEYWLGRPPPWDRLKRVGSYILGDR